MGKARWELPGKFQEPVGEILSAFTVSLPGVRITAVDPPAHPGFQAVQTQIARRSGVGMARAGAILAAASRRASPAAKRKNPRLQRVKGKAR